jgi:hypothetical protein
MREPDLEEEDLRATIAGGRLEILRRSLSPEHPEVEVILPSGETQKVALEPGRGGRASATIAAAEGGLYRIGDGRRTALAAAGPLNPREFEDLRASPAALAPLVAASGGAVVRLIADGLPALRKVGPRRDRFGRGWIGITANRAHLVTGVAQTPLLPAIVLLFLALGAALFAWYREGR